MCYAFSLVIAFLILGYTPARFVNQFTIEDTPARVVIQLFVLIEMNDGVFLDCFSSAQPQNGSFENYFKLIIYFILISRVNLEGSSCPSQPHINKVLSAVLLL